MLRREFLAASALSPGLALAAPPPRFAVWKTLGGLREEDGATPLEGARWFVAEAPGDGMLFEFAAGTLARSRCISSDMLLDGTDLAVFELVLLEGAQGRAFRFRFGALNQCSFRFRLDLSLVDQHVWLADREGAFLKPTCDGDRVDLARVDRMSFSLLRKGPQPARWAMTELQATPAIVPRLASPVLPKGPLVDELGQSRLRDWPGKTRSLEQLRQRLAGQAENAPRQTWPESFSRWGGARARKLGEATGWFRTQKQDGRWWLVDPDGCAFWSAGLDCVRVDGDARIDGIESALAWLPQAPDYADALRNPQAGRRQMKSVNFLAANMIRAFGPAAWREKWAAITLAEMKRLRFNTVGNWSDTEWAAKAAFPYVRPLSFRATRCGLVYRDFPDVFHSGFSVDCTEYAAALTSTASDPALLGYFLMNEPTWAFSSELPAQGMLYNTPACAAREELARRLRAKYDGDEALSKAWKAPASLERVARGKWQGVFTAEALDDLRDFSVVMVERYFSAISKACRAVDPHHLNLGMRWQGVPEYWAVGGMKHFDVFSLNCYQEKLPRAAAEKIHSLVGAPVLVGEWHFGALDAGLPGSGIGHLKNQAERAKAYRVYLEDAAADPYCVGVHWFTLYDQSALGRFDGENYNIGFLDITNRAYDEMGQAAILSHERMYEVAAGTQKPFGEAPEYLPKVFL